MRYQALLVEDDKEFAGSLSSSLMCHKNNVSFHVDTCGSISECTQKLLENNYDVIILDLNLSNGQGEATFSKIYEAANRNIGRHDENRTAIVVLTGDEAIDYSPIVTKGAMDFIVKPVGVAELSRRLHMAILKFPFKRAEEIHDSIDSTIKQAREALCNLR